jgi:predicted ATPase
MINDASETQSTNDGNHAPRRYFDQITFETGDSVNLGWNDTVVIVGPNNSGKSALLRGLTHAGGYDGGGGSEVNVSLRNSHSFSQFGQFIRENVPMLNIGYKVYEGPGYRLFQDYLASTPHRSNQRWAAPYFGTALFCSNRITGSDPAKALPHPGELSDEMQAIEPIHDMVRSSVVAERISAAFFRAFGKHLIVYRGHGTRFPLYVSDVPRESLPSDDFAHTTLDAFEEAGKQLMLQGDGMRSFATIVLSLFQSDQRSQILIDEPEAFLHPPQARVMGMIIGRLPSRPQQFIATHSVDILNGLLASGNEGVRILRLHRDGDKVGAKELRAERLQQIVRDPFSRFSGLLQGVFYQHVVVTEGDSDALFFQSLLHTNSVSGGKQGDVLFVHASGKHRLGQMVRTLADLYVPATVIADIDLIREKDQLKGVFEALGGQWEEIESDWSSIAKKLENPGGGLTVGRVRHLLNAALQEHEDMEPFTNAMKRSVAEACKVPSPWDAVKRAGRSALPDAIVTKAFDRLVAACEAVGLLILQVGVLESFCPTVEASKGRFVGEVLSTMDLNEDPCLEGARTFVKKIWKRVSEH